VTLAAVLVLSAAVVGVAMAQAETEYVRGEPDLDVYVSEPTVTPGTATQLELQVTNRGEVDAGAAANRELVTTARGVTVEITDEGPFELSAGPHAIGSIADGAVADVPIATTVPADVEPGEHEIDVRLRYAHTSQSVPQSGVVQDRTRSVRRTVDVTVDDGARFSLRTVESDVRVGDRGTVDVELENVGGETARELTLGLDSTTADVIVGDDGEQAARIDRLAPGENVTVPFDVAVRETASVRNVTLAGTVAFTDPDGVTDTAEDLSTALRPSEEQAFTLAVEESTLRVGERGTVRGTIRNDGPAVARDVAVSVGEGQLGSQARRYAVGDLEPGATAPFEFRATLPADADAVPRRLDVTTTYRTAADTDRTTTQPIRVAVDDRRDAIDVTPVDATFAAGESGTLTLDVVNRLDEPVRDVRVTLVVEPPLESEFRTAIVPDLEPGASDRVAFDLDVDGDAPASRFPATVELEYADDDDERATARPSTIAVEVTDAGTGVPATEIAGIAIVLLLVGVGGWWFYGKRFV
jgi:hypothetical protein